MAKHYKLDSSLGAHPGEKLKEILEARSFEQAEFSRISGVSSSSLWDIIHGIGRVTKKQAVRIGNALQMDPKYWLRLQKEFDIDRKGSREE